MRAYLRSLNPQLPRDVWILQAGGLVNMFGNGVIGPFLIIYLHNVRGISFAEAGFALAFGGVAALATGLLVIAMGGVALWMPAMRQPPASAEATPPAFRNFLPFPNGRS